MTKLTLGVATLVGLFLLGSSVAQANNGVCTLTCATTNGVVLNASVLDPPNVDNSLTGPCSQGSSSCEACLSYLLDNDCEFDDDIGGPVPIDANGTAAILIMMKLDD